MTADLKYLKLKLDILYDLYDYNYIESDPVKYIHRYDGKENREIVGFISSALAYGNVRQIFTSVEKILKILGPSPFEFAKNFDIVRDSDLFKDFKHRFNNGTDISVLFWFLHQIYDEYPTMEECFFENYSENDETIEKALTGFVSRILLLKNGPFYHGALPKNAGVRYFLSSPEKKSACKRMNMFLRWMVRKNDKIDCGIWKKISPAKLILPLDAHTARISQYIGLTERKSSSWLMALEVTDNLKKMEPDDPVKYDFALSRLGILDKCEHKYKQNNCEKCELFSICRLTVKYR
ncbi:TIGR02757 family protein [candidate division KSB1 bacterium]